MAHVAAAASRQTFSVQVSDAIQTYRHNKGFLAEQTRSVQSACADWDVQTDNLSKGQYDQWTVEQLKGEMYKQVDRYRDFRRAREQANVVFNFLGRIIGGVTRTDISEADYETLAQAGFPVKWARQNTQLRKDILPQLDRLATRVGTLKAKIEGQIKPTANCLNNALSYFYAKTGLSTLTLSAKNVYSKAYLDDAIAVREAQLAAEAPQAVVLDVAAPADPAALALEEAEVDTSKQEVERLTALLEELQEMTKNIALDGADVALPQDDAPALAPPPAALVGPSAVVVSVGPAAPAAAPAAPVAAPAAPAAAPAAPVAAPAAPADALAAPVAAPAAPAAAPAAPVAAASDDDEVAPTLVPITAAATTAAPVAMDTAEDVMMSVVSATVAKHSPPAKPAPGAPAVKADGKEQEDFPALPSRTTQPKHTRGPLPSQQFGSRAKPAAAAVTGSKKNA